MRRILGIAVAAILFTGSIPPPAWAKSEYRAPEITRAGNIKFPVNALRTGIVTLAVNLDAAGNVTRLDVLRDFPPFTSAAYAAVKTWTFAPATLDGQATSSVLPISVVFNPFNPAGVSNLPSQIPLSPVNPASNSGYVPPEITSAYFAAYPVNSEASGSVVLNVTIGKTGDLLRVHVIRSTPALTPQVLQAIKTWRFLPATWNGKPVVSRMGVSFVFPSAGSVNY
ncbi:MAG TPA: TonB family protein [Verrucomicrobiae bacterium]|nr:TonB family protein [Verrucomicrobiae bacterium]